MGRWLRASKMVCVLWGLPHLQGDGRAHGTVERPRGCTRVSRPPWRRRRAAPVMWEAAEIWTKYGLMPPGNLAPKQNVPAVRLFIILSLNSAEVRYSNRCDTLGSAPLARRRHLPQSTPTHPTRPVAAQVARSRDREANGGRGGPGGAGQPWLCFNG